MNSSYIAHDCTLEDFVTISGAMIGGTCFIGRNANLGLNVSVHQRRTIGAGAMVGMGAIVTRDIAPFAKAFGSPCKVQGANSIGMSRMGIQDESIQQITMAILDGNFLMLKELIPSEMSAFEAAQSSH
jgi:UDP-N-acetylglucosamine acyltransferase